MTDLSMSAMMKDLVSQTVKAVEKTVEKTYPTLTENEKLRVYAVGKLKDGAGYLEAAKEAFEGYLSALQKHQQMIPTDIEDLAQFSDVDAEDVTEVIRGLNEMILLMMSSGIPEDD